MKRETNRLFTIKQIILIPIIGDWIAIVLSNLMHLDIAGCIGLITLYHVIITGLLSILRKEGNDKVTETLFDENRLFLLPFVADIPFFILGFILSPDRVLIEAVTIFYHLIMSIEVGIVCLIQRKWIYSLDIYTEEEVENEKYKE